MRFLFNRNYFLCAGILLITEFAIAIYAHDAIIRSYGGDFLVVILLYCTVHAFFNVNILSSAISVLFFAYAVETLQYFHFVNALGLGKNMVARIIMGTNFEWTDLLMYTLGILFVLLFETKILHKTLR